MAKVDCSWLPVFLTTWSIMTLYKVFIPGSLNCDAMVPYTGMSSTGLSHKLWLRWYCLRTSRRASRAPRLSNLLSAMTSAKSSMSIFSSWVAAPYSGVMTYKDTSEWSRISVSDCPIPEVSKIMRSYFAAFRIEIASATCFDSARLDWRVAKERMYTRGLLMAFMRMRSPRSAPPVFLLEGSTETTASCLSGKSTKKRRTSSSTKDDLPDPPVPVIPSTGTAFFVPASRSALMSAAFSSGKFSAALIL